MERNGDTPRALSAVLGFTPTKRSSHIYQLLNPDHPRRLNYTKLLKLANHFDIPLITLTDGTEVIDTGLLTTALSDVIYHLYALDASVTDATPGQLSCAAVLLYRARIDDREHESMIEELVGSLLG